MDERTLRERTKQTARMLFHTLTSGTGFELWKKFDRGLARELSMFFTGVLYSREVIPQKQRELCAVAALTALHRRTRCARTSTRPSTSAPRGRRWPRSSSRWSPTAACRSSSTRSRSTDGCSPSAASPFPRKSPRGERSGARRRGRRRSGGRAGRDEVLQCRVRDHAEG